MFFLDGVLVLSEEHRLLLAPEVGELPLERRQRQGLRVVPPDDGVDDLRRYLHHPDGVAVSRKCINRGWIFFKFCPKGKKLSKLGLGDWQMGKDDVFYQKSPKR